MQSVKNPILAGFYPDPSMCFANGKYYLVTSTFAYFPGVPIFESEDLHSWRQIGHVLTRSTQLPLLGARQSQGIFAPSIRFHDGIFYMITTNVSHRGNFVVTASDPAGEWSDPHYIEGAAGIDPSLFFDDDGTCYYIGQRENPAGPKYYGDCVVWIQKFNTQTMQLEGDFTAVWGGAMKNAIWPEAPHIYKKDGYYYLLHAEGGTSFSHANTIARSREIFGPYEGSPNNPFFSHRTLGKNFPIQNVGHADMVQTPDGEWYTVMLATRPKYGHTLLGRETFIARVAWENGWPVFNPSEGRLLDTQPIHLPKKNVTPVSNFYRFTAKTLDKRLVGIRLLNEEMYALGAELNCLRLFMRNVPITDMQNPSYLGVRQQHHNFFAHTFCEIKGEKDGDLAGLVLHQSNEDHVQFVAQRQGGAYALKAIVVKKGEARVAEAALLSQGEALRIYLRIIQEENVIRLEYALEDGNFLPFADNICANFMSTESAWGFVGCTVGMYAEGAANSGGYADFDYFAYEAL